MKVADVKFAHRLAEHDNATRAYRESRECSHLARTSVNTLASALAKQPEIVRLVEEISQAAVEDAKLTRAWVVKRLMHEALTAGEAASRIAGLSQLAKILGISRIVQEHHVHDMSDEQLARELEHVEEQLAVLHPETLEDMEAQGQA